MSNQRQTRDRPLQNSMFLPQPAGNNTRRPSIPIDYNFPMPNVKKVQQGFNNTQTHFQQPHHNYLITQTTSTRQFHTQGSVDQIIQPPRNNQPIIHELYQKMDKLSRMVEKHQFQLSSLSIQGDFSKRVMSEIKKNLPVFTGGNDVYDHILNMKVDIKNLQDDINKFPKINDLDSAIKKQLQSYNKLGQSSATSSTSLTGSSVKPGQIDPMVTDVLRKRDDFFQNIITNLETEVSMLKKNLSNINLQMKVSPVTSPSCIILKYQQLFKAKNKGESDMVLSQCTYYIDNEGHLLDCHSRYLVDQKGKRIKLEDKHINLLRSQKILQ